jgi:hypothetical protein
VDAGLSGATARAACRRQGCSGHDSGEQGGSRPVAALALDVEKRVAAKWPTPRQVSIRIMPSESPLTAAGFHWRNSADSRPIGQAWGQGGCGSRPSTAVRCSPLPRRSLYAHWPRLRDRRVRRIHSTALAGTDLPRTQCHLLSPPSACAQMQANPTGLSGCCHRCFRRPFPLRPSPFVAPSRPSATTRSQLG